MQTSNLLSNLSFGMLLMTTTIDEISQMGIQKFLLNTLAVATAIVIRDLIEEWMKKKKAQKEAEEKEKEEFRKFKANMMLSEKCASSDDKNSQKTD